MIEVVYFSRALLLTVDINDLMAQLFAVYGDSMEVRFRPMSALERVSASEPSETEEMSKVNTRAFVFEVQGERRVNADDIAVRG